MLSVIAEDQIPEVETFDHDMSQPDPGLFQKFLQGKQIETGNTSSRGAEGATTAAATKTHSLQIEVAGGPLDIGEGIGIYQHHPVEFISRDQGVLKLAMQLLGMMLDRPIQGDQIAIKIVNDLGSPRLFGKEDIGCPGEHLDITLVLMKSRNNGFSEMALAAKIRYDCS